ncbi:MAG: methylmalonyl-CoA mutase family protein [bacterium]
MSQKIKSEKDKWKKKFEACKKRNITFTTVSGEQINPLYTPDDLENLDYVREVGFPGQYPFTRGVYDSMYRGRLWTMRMFSGFGSAADTNKRYHYLLEHGQTGLSVAFDFPTLYGRDSDDPFSCGEVGKCGVAISSLADMERLFKGIPLEKVSTSMTINGPAAILWAFYIATAEKQGVGSEKLRGTIQNDVLKEYIAQKSWLIPPEPSMRLTVDTMEYGYKHVPKWNTISISGYHIREAGSTAAQELAFTLADGFAYVDAGIQSGLDVDSFAPRLSFFFNSHLDFFEEIAKYRAARRIWAREMKNKYGAKNQRSLLMRFHTQTAGCTLTAQQPENNIVRVAWQALAAVLGGTQSLHTNSMDETLALPSEKAVLIALRTQQLIAHESGAANTIDPLAGSYFIESLTNKMEERAYEYFDKIEKLGGIINAVEKGYPQKEIAKAAYQYQKEIEEKKRIVVGLNEYKINNEKIEIPLLEVDPQVEKDQNERLEELRKKRDNQKVKRTLNDLKDTCNSTDNLMYPILEAARAYATLGEIAGVLKEVFGEYREPPTYW